MDFGEELVKLFGSNDFYEILGVSKTSSSEVIKKAYKTKALIFHPDRAESGEEKEATEKFQALSRISCTLLNAHKKHIYDTAGINQDLFTTMGSDTDWSAFWCEVFPPIGRQDIENFENRYKNSKEELKDIKDAYIKTNGDIMKMLNHVLCSTVDDVERIKQIVQKLIDSKELPILKHFNKNIDGKLTKARRRMSKEAKEIDQSSFDTLSKAILSKRSSKEEKFDEMIDNLAAKYGATKKVKKSKNVKTKRKKLNFVND